MTAPDRIWIGSAAWFDRPYGNQQGYVREDLATAQDCILEVDRQERRIKSLQRENERLKAICLGNESLSKWLDENEELRSLVSKQAEALADKTWPEVPAITPEMRERIGAHQKRLENPNTQLRQWALAADQIFSDLLGEQG